MSRITFKRSAQDEWRVYDHDGDHVGDVYRQPDILEPGAHYFLVWLFEEHVAASVMLRRSRISLGHAVRSRTAAT